MRQLLTIFASAACALFLGAFPAVVTAQASVPNTARTTLPMGVEALAPQWCAVLPSSGGLRSVGGSTNTAEPNGSEVRIVDLVDQTTLSTRAARMTFGMEAACNYPHRVSIRSQNNGLRRQNLSTGVGIANAVPYTATLNWGNVDLSLFADASSVTQLERVANTSEAVSGPLVIDVAVVAGATNLGPNRPLGAGEYSDIISIEVGPL